VVAKEIASEVVSQTTGVSTSIKDIPSIAKNGLKGLRRVVGKKGGDKTLTESIDKTPMKSGHKSKLETEGKTAPPKQAAQQNQQSSQSTQADSSAAGGAGGARLDYLEQQYSKALTKKTKLPEHTTHSLHQKIYREVKTADELDALRNPLQTTAVKTDSLGRESQRLVGEKATMAINPSTNKIVSVNPTSTKRAKKLKKKKHGGSSK